MRNTDTFKQYIWLVDTIRMSRKISLKRIQELWIEDDLNDRQSLSRTTFYRIRQAIEDMFGIHIGCDNQNQMIPLLRTLPKHPSQKEIATTETYSDFEYFLVPSCLDFQQAILKEGNELEVLEPESLRNEIKAELQTALSRYQ